MLARTESIAIVGTEGRLVTVEVYCGNGVPALTIVGLPNASVREAAQRTRAAIESAGHRWPPRRITANLAPGAIRKEGTHYDLSVALGILCADGRIDGRALGGWVVVGELALDGSVRAVPGTLAAALACRAAGRRGLICPDANAPEAALVDGIEVIAVDGLRTCIDFLAGGVRPPPPAAAPPVGEPPAEDLAEVRGHPAARRALEVAAAGGHNLLLVGPPGSGKTMLARRLPGILPPLTDDEALEVTRTYSVAGLLAGRPGLVTARPFRCPHHNVSMAGLVGGGAGIARPGEISLASRGVLFLDELALYRADVLDSLRAPLEDGVVRIARSGGVISYPCRFSLVAAMNPCPCGYLGDGRRPCRCSQVRLEHYRCRLSGPLLDRFDIQVAMARPTRTELLDPRPGEPSAAVRERVVAARALQAERYGSGAVTNATAPKSALDAAAEPSPGAAAALSAAVESLALSGRGINRVLRLARTIADLRAGGGVTENDVIEAVALRADDGVGGVAA